MFHLSLPLLLWASLLGSPAQEASPPGQPGANKAAQDEAPQEKKSLREKLRERQRAKSQVVELRRPDGTLVLPGEIPAHASADSRATWEALVDSMQGPGRIQSFEMSFELRQRSQEKSQRNDVTMIFAYHAPGFVRAHLETGRELLRGPKGDFLIDKAEVIALSGREGVEDIKQLDQMVSIAGSFVGLTDPRTLRLIDLQLIQGPELALPARIKPEELEGLIWIRIKSPDFSLFNGRTADKTKPAIVQADLGIHGDSKSIRFAVLREEADPGMVPPGALFVHMANHLQRGHLFVPHVIKIFELDAALRPPAFHKKPTSELYLKRNRGSFGADLNPSDFMPPGQ